MSNSSIMRDNDFDQLSEDDVVTSPAIASSAAAAGVADDNPKDRVVVAELQGLEIAVQSDRPTLAIGYLPDSGEMYVLSVECREAGHTLTYRTSTDGAAAQQWIGRLDHGTTGARTTLWVRLRNTRSQSTHFSARIVENDHCTTIVCRDEDQQRNAVATLILLTRQDAE